MTSDRVCSARGCRAPAGWALRWNNPKLHPPQRRKVWLACDEHRESLGAFLQLRGFLRETGPVAELPADDSADHGVDDRADGKAGDGADDAPGRPA